MSNEKLVNKASGSYGIIDQELEQVKFRIHIHQSNKHFLQNVCAQKRTNPTSRRVNKHKE